MASRTWGALNLSPWVNEAISSMGFDEMTPVQANTIPLFLQHKDVVVEAVTGSGKTLAFLLPLVERLLAREEALPTHHVGALVICPTRELAIQIESVLHSLLTFAPSRRTDEEKIEYEANDMEKIISEPGSERPEEQVAVDPLEDAKVLGLCAQILIGGTTTVQQDVSTFRKKSPTILIGTPGRIHDFLQSCKTVSTKELEMLVMDEADRLLDMGFHDVLNNIIHTLPKQRRTGLFSATMTDAVSQLVRTGLRNPVKIVVKVQVKAGQDRRTPTSLQIGYMVVRPSDKIAQMIRLLHYSLKQDKLTKSIVYFPTCASVDYFAPLLSQLSALKKFTLIPLHGKQAPSVRQKNYKKFVSLGAGTPSVLLATDLAARGLDIADVDLVLQIDPPQDPAAFAHRCGRAGRAGRAGKAIVLLNQGREEEYVPFLAVRKTPVFPIPRLNETYEIITETNDTYELGIKAINDKMRALVRKDRDLYERGMKAFVSYIRFYKKHQAVYIFRFQDLDIGAAAASYGLLRLPSMPELKDQKTDYDNEAVDMKTFAYADKTREAARLAALQKDQEKLELDGGAALVEKKAHKDKKTLPAWSNKLDARNRKEARQDKKKRKRDAIMKVKTAEKTAARGSGAISSDDDGEQDWKELRKERLTAKRARRKSNDGESVDSGASAGESVVAGMFADL